MKSTGLISTWLESSVSPALRAIVLTEPSQFTLVANPEQAEVILFENDEPQYIRQTNEFKRYPEKCIVINENDLPSYFLPACYASNRRFWLSHKRAQTIPYYVSQRTIPNPFINDFTTIDSPRYLYSFKGGSTSWLRKKLFKRTNNHPDVYIQEANHYHHWNYEESYTNQKLTLQQEYADLLKQSWFFLCPRGVGVSSIRLFEVMQAGRVPVILADEWVPLAGINWDEFSLRIPENDLEKIDSLIRLREHDAKRLGLNARRVWEDYCSPDAQSKFLAQSVRSIQQNRNQQREQFLHLLFPVLEAVSTGKGKARHLLKYLILKGFALTGRRFPYSLNRPIEEQLNKMKSS